MAVDKVFVYAVFRGVRPSLGGLLGQAGVKEGRSPLTMQVTVRPIGRDDGSVPYSRPANRRHRPHMAPGRVMNQRNGLRPPRLN
jgi:hypothetical protein